MPSPNILFILSDQLRRSALGCHGDPDARTPNIDALADRGVRCDATNSTYPICVPYRFSLMTGQYAHSRQVPGIEWRMSPTERTLADEFNEAGYETVYVGKWHLAGGHGPGLFKRPVPRELQGRWQKWFGFEFRNSFFDTAYFEDDNETPIQIDGYQTDGLTDRTIDYLTNHRDRSRPFCCVLSVEAPHPPFEAPAKYQDAWLKRDITLPPNFMIDSPVDDNCGGWGSRLDDDARESLIANRKVYHAMVENLDDNVGRLMAALEQSGDLENTIVIFTADHGELGGSHRLRSKQYPYEESAGVPLILAGPTMPQGEVFTAPTNTEDLFPTLLGLAGIPQRDPANNPDHASREPLPGENLAPALRGQQLPPDRLGVMLEFVAELRPPAPFHTSIWRGVRSHRFKYATFGGLGRGMTPWMFYDLENDPYETTNLIDDPKFAQDMAAHHQFLRDEMVRTGDHAWLGEACGCESLNEWTMLPVRG